MQTTFKHPGTPLVVQGHTLGHYQVTSPTCAGYVMRLLDTYRKWNPVPHIPPAESLEDVVERLQGLILEAERYGIDTLRTDDVRDAVVGTLHLEVNSDGNEYVHPGSM